MLNSYFLLIIIVLVPSIIVTSIFKNRRKKYGKLPLTAGLTGREVAEKMLRENMIYDVPVVVSDGLLTDHYNPKNKTVSLSPEIYNGNSVFSAAVAAHECGHAVQHAKSYAFLQMRSALVPVVTFSSQFVSLLIIAGILLLNVLPQLMLAGIVLFGVLTVFSFITLPVEFNASHRAILWLQTAGLTNTTESIMVRNALKWAAMTYVVAALGSLVTLFYYIMIFAGRRS